MPDKTEKLEKKLSADEQRAAAQSALLSAITAVDESLKALPDYGGTEADDVKGARGMLLGVAGSLEASLEAAGGGVEGSAVRQALRMGQEA